MACLKDQFHRYSQNVLKWTKNIFGYCVFIYKFHLTSSLQLPRVTIINNEVKNYVWVDSKGNSYVTQIKWLYKKKILTFKNTSIIKLSA